MPIAYTSRAAFYGMIESLSGARLAVYEVIANWDSMARGIGPTIEDIAIELGKKDNAISGRITELRKAGAIKAGPMKLNKSGNAASTWTAVQYREFRYKAKTETNGQMAFL